MPQLNIPDLKFKTNFAECVKRHLALQKAERGCLIFTNIAADAPSEAANNSLPPLEEIDFDADPLRVARYFCDGAETIWATRKDYPDDSIPHVAPRFGTGIIGGMLLGDIEFGANTSWTHPVGTSLDGALEFTWGKENVWIDRVVENLQYMADRMRGKCYTFLEGYHTPLEWATAVRGSEIYLEIITEPDKAHALIKRCNEALMWLYHLLDERVSKDEYGALAYNLWMERCVPFLSDDSAGNMSPEHYAEFGVPYTDAMFGHFGGGFLHFHTLAYHQMENLNHMKNLTVYHWRLDPKIPEPAEILEKLLPGAKTKIVCISMAPREIRDKIDILAEGRFIVSTTVKDRAEQDEIIQLIREKAPIH